MKKIPVSLLFLALFISQVSAQPADWPHINASGAKVRHIIILNHLLKPINFSISGFASRVMQPGDSVVLEHAHSYSSARCSGYYTGTTTLGALSLAEWTMGNLDFYDVSLVDGFNIPVRMFPVKGTFSATPSTYQCDTAGCTKDLLPTCPAELQVKNAAGEVTTCLSACSKFNTDAYCCKGANSTPQTCPATNYSRIFKAACPWAYSYAYDDQSSTFTCPMNATAGIGPDYVIEFGYFGASAALNPVISLSGIGCDRLTNTKGNVLRYALNGVRGNRMSLALYSCSGKLLMETGITAPSGSIALEGINKGVYIAALKAGHVLLAQRTVVVK